MVIKRLISLLLGSAVMLTSMASCGAQSSRNDNKSSAVQKSSQNGGGKDMTAENVKLLGRTYAAADGKVWMGLSGTGVELIFTGSKLSVTLIGNGGESDKLSRIGIFVDGERTQDICVSDSEQTADIDGKGDTSVNVSIIKLSECASSCCAITGMDAHGGKIEKAAPKQRRIEFIGDSITCGYGVDDQNLYHGYSTMTEDCTKTYAIKTAQALNADHSLVSFSGYGIVSGYTPDQTKNTYSLVSPYYESYGFTENTGFDRTNPSQIKWDFSRFTPDVIVIFLGTNDISYTGYDADRQNEYMSEYVEFLKKVRSKNAGAKIICTLGTMGDVLNGKMNEAVSQYSAQTGDNNICSFDLPVQDIAADGCVINQHPTEATYEKAAKLLSDKIRSEMNW